MENYPAQLVTLVIQAAWTTSVEGSLESGYLPEGPLEIISQALDLLTDIVLRKLGPVTRHMCEHLIAELIHQRDVTRALIQQRFADTKSSTGSLKWVFTWDDLPRTPSIVWLSASRTRHSLTVGSSGSTRANAIDE